jgi:hypothetical protein
MSELALSFTAQINALHRMGQELDTEFGRLILDKLNATRECGQLCATAKEDLSAGEWNRLTKDLDFDKAALQAYMTFARRHPEPFTELKECIRGIEAALQTTGLLAFPEGHGLQTLHPPNLFSWMAKQVTTFTSELKKRIDSDPVATWSPETAEQFVVQLEPLLKKLLAIMEEARERAND